jgi:immunoglobulin-like protein involved in spore germination
MRTVANLVGGNLEPQRLVILNAARVMRPTKEHAMSTRYTVVLTVVTFGLLSLLEGCGDDAGVGSAPGITTTIASTTAVPPTSDLLSETTAIDAVRTFARDVVGMVDPVVGPARIESATATVEVRTRREDGRADPTLPATIVRLTATGRGWTIRDATGDTIAISDPQPDWVVPSGAVTAGGVASAYEGTVIVQVLAITPTGVRRVGRAVTTGRGDVKAPWRARVDIDRDATGTGYVLAASTAGTEQGAPAFALVPIRFAS